MVIVLPLKAASLEATSEHVATTSGRVDEFFLLLKSRFFLKYKVLEEFTPK